MNSTIVSMTDITGKTGNVDYSDCRIPSDQDLVDAAARYGLTSGIRYTITSVIGNKKYFTADIVNGKLIRTSEEVQSLAALKRISTAVCTQEVEKLEKYTAYDFNSPLILDKLGLTEKEVWEMVNERKRGLWFHVPTRYDKAMFNCVIEEYIADHIGNEFI